MKKCAIFEKSDVCQKVPYCFSHLVSPVQLFFMPIFWKRKKNTTSFFGAVRISLAFQTMIGPFMCRQTMQRPSCRPDNHETQTHEATPHASLAWLCRCKTKTTQPSQVPRGLGLPLWCEEEGYRKFVDLKSY